MEQIDRQRFFTMAETYDRMCQSLVPQYDFLQGEVLRIPTIDRGQDITVVDLGAGSGIFLEKVLTRWPRARCYWIDHSQNFLQLWCAIGGRRPPDSARAQSEDPKRCDRF